MGAGMAKLSVALISERLLMTAKDTPAAREAHSTVDLGNGKLLVFGGGSSSNEEAEQYNDLVSIPTGARVTHTREFERFADYRMRSDL